MYHDSKPRQTETLWAKYRAKNKQNHNTKKVIEKEKKTKYKKRLGICTYSYNIYKWFNNGQWICSHVPCPESIITYNEGHTV